MIRVAVAAAAGVALLLAGAAHTATGPTSTSAPTVTGTLQQGAKLTGTPGNWLGSGTITYAYQWYRCDANGAHCSSIHGATTSTYTQVAKDVGATLGLTVRATDGTGTTAAYAAIAGLVAPAQSNLTAAKQPALAGAPVVGRALTVTGGTWIGVASSTTYAWLRCNANGRACATIAGAATAAYTVAGADVGHVLVAAVTGTTGSTKRTVLTTGTGVARAAAGPVNAVLPSVTGTLQQGRRLSALPGTWLGSGAIAYRYQWHRCDAAGAHCSSIRGATKPTYTLVPKDVNATIGLTVTATDSTGKASAYASLAGPIAAAAAALVATTQPAISGSASVAGSLSVGAPTWSATVASATTSWLRCNANGRVCAPIAGAATSTYTPTAADAGHRLVAQIQATSGSAKQTALSLESSVVST
jgi:hypothetical protein